MARGASFLWIIGCTALLLILLAPDPLGPALVLGFLLAALAAPQLPIMGRLNPGFPLFGALLGEGSALPGWLSPVALLALVGLRLLERRHRNLRVQAREMASEALPFGLAALPLALSLPQGELLSAALYLGGVWILGPLLLAEASQNGSYLEARALSFPLLALGSLPALAFPGLPRPALLGLSWAAAGACGVSARILLDALCRTVSSTPFSREAGVVSELEVALRQTRQEVAARLEERLVLQELAKLLAASKGLQETLKTTTAMLKRLVPFNTLILFAAPDMQAVFCSRAQAGIPPSSAAALLSQAWSQQKVVLVRGEVAAARVLEDEPVGVLLPMRGVGLLYVGRQTAWSKSELHWLALVTDPLIPALLAGQQQQQVRRAAEELAQSNSLLHHANQRLIQLLEVFSRVAACAGPDEIRATLQEQVRRVLPASRLVHVSLWEDREETALEPTLATAVEKIRERQRLVAKGPVMGCPLRSGPEGLGALVVVLEQGKPGKEDLEMLDAIGYQAGALLRNALLHQAVRRAHQDLQDSQAQLVQSSKMAAVGQLATGLAHELNSPLASIVLGLQVAVRAAEDGMVEDIPATLEIAQTSARAAQEIVDNLLTTSRFSSTLAPVELATLLHRVARLCGPQLANDGVRLEVNAGPPVSLMGYESELGQVITNLILNGRDAALSGSSPKRTVALDWTCEHSEARIRVSDSGDGVADDIVDRIFEPFFTTKPIGKGTGLGLSVSFGCVQKHSGTIAYRREGERSVFEVCLPLNSPAR